MRNGSLVTIRVYAQPSEGSPVIMQIAFGHDQAAQPYVRRGSG